MELKDYQKDTLAVVGEFFEQLSIMRAKADKAREIDEDLEFDYVQRAWKKVVPSHPFLPRKNGLGKPLPCFCLKIPTGGGKTLLATKVIDLANTHIRKQQTGLVLWVVPSTQIYNQTLAALKDRDHPYRQFLDIASGGRTLILEKKNGFSPADVQENLCILMLMLPAANRETKEQLRMFRDNGGYDRFFPADDDAKGHETLLDRIPNLHTFDKQSGFWGRQIKTSLGNTMKLLQPMIILDEGHKAYSENARKTLEDFNPSMIVELTATPPKTANVLVEIMGNELNREGMIKLDLHIQNRRNTNWKDTLLAAVDHRDSLESEARQHEANTNNYIRPICLIQVERTGKDQRKPAFVHAEDVREYLVNTQGIPADQIAIKTSQKDELKEVDEVGGLMSRDCPIRYIITKQALQEGWDCSFAYVLAILANPSSKTAVTQLVGRILRQPYARKTGIPALDESYVYCFQRRGQDLLSDVRKGFGKEGLGDLKSRVIEDKEGATSGAELTVLEHRSQFKGAVKKLVMPAFFIRDGNRWRLVHYEADILSRISWDGIDIAPLWDIELRPRGDKDVEIRAGLEEGILDGSPEARATALDGSTRQELDYAFVAGHLLDVLPNPWRGNEVARTVFEGFLKKADRELVLDNFVFIVEELRKRLEVERDRLAEDVFRSLLKSGEMRFMVVAEDLGFNRLPKKIAVRKGEKRATRLDGNQFMLSLFEHVPEDDLNELEQKVATYLDDQECLFFWYRNMSRRDYAVQGWKKQRIYADFIFGALTDSSSKKTPYDTVFVVETKGMHLRANTDSAYKRSVFDVCNEHAKQKHWSEFVPTMDNKSMRFEIVDEEEWERRLNGLLTA